QTHAYILQASARHANQHSFPTRRSSDLGAGDTESAHRDYATPGTGKIAPVVPPSAAHARYSVAGDQGKVASVDREGRTGRAYPRSEEHTSELQSPYDIVCRLLLEKKKKK